MGEVDRRHGQRAQRRQHPQLDARLVALDVDHELFVQQEAERVQRHRQRARRRLGERARVPGAQHPHLIHAEAARRARSACCSRRRRPCTATPSISTGSKTAGSAALASTDSTAGPDDSNTSRPVSTSTATTCSGIGASSSRANGTWRSINERSGPRVERSSAAGRRTRADPGAGRAGTRRCGAAPSTPVARSSIGRVGMPGQPRAVERADRGAHDHVRADSPLAQGGQHPDLDRAEAGAPRENERNRHRRKRYRRGPRTPARIGRTRATKR